MQQRRDPAKPYERQPGDFLLIDDKPIRPCRLRAIDIRKRERVGKGNRRFRAAGGHMIVSVLRQRTQGDCRTLASTPSNTPHRTASTSVVVPMPRAGLKSAPLIISLCRSTGRI
jgi:hypothetical protein